MKKILLFFLICLLTSCTSNTTTTYYLIRHAEKDQTDTTNKNPNLNKKGKERAKKWAIYFNDIDLDAIYSTNYQRTIQTAKPTAKNKNLEIIHYNPSKMYDADFQLATKGKNVLIVGHSNTTPAFANQILSKKQYKNMAHNDNASLYIVKITGDKKVSTLEKID